MSEKTRNYVCDICGGDNLRVQIWVDVNSGAEINGWPDGDQWDQSCYCDNCHENVQVVEADEWTGPKQECIECGEYFLETEIDGERCPVCKEEYEREQAEPYSRKDESDGW